MLDPKAATFLHLTRNYGSMAMGMISFKTKEAGRLASGGFNASLEILFSRLALKMCSVYP